GRLKDLQTPPNRRRPGYRPKPPRRASGLVVRWIFADVGPLGSLFASLTGSLLARSLPFCRDAARGRDGPATLSAEPRREEADAFCSPGGFRGRASVRRWRLNNIAMVLFTALLECGPTAMFTSCAPERWLR